MFDMVPFRRNNSLGRGSDFENFVDSFFNNNFFAPFNAYGFGNGFRADLKETDDAYFVEADLPGVKKDAITAEYDNNYLTISAKRADSKEENNDNYIRREICYGDFKRSFYIDNVDKNNITASFRDGVLKVCLPKLQKTPKENTRINID
ncbi:Hsp20/alpha crystallin family protein [Clostridium sp. cel8]|jgi:HSP20 family protein|uniref:heat shock protein Hsp18 n=1 Tax=unclassified Clostridium TaxID=2614128 RepID=UPI0015F4FBCA|nr:heat shock protein Hsp18 [Clostridium sp. cel8]MBA5851666.1 Hsp20/alpha crystallin family protein [Clostridium sp. cel8]